MIIEFKNKHKLHTLQFEHLSLETSPFSSNHWLKPPSRTLIDWCPKYCRYETNTACMKKVPLVWNKYLRYETNLTGMKQLPHVWKKLHRYETSSTGMNQVSQVWNKYTTGMKQVSRVWNKCHRYETSTTCMKQQLCIAWVDIINRTFQRDLRVNYCLNSSHSKI